MTSTKNNEETLSENLVTSSDKEYIISEVFTQMPATYPEEALKAQAVIAQTELIRKRYDEISTDELIKDSLTKEKLKAIYGEYFDECYEKITAAANYAYGKCICYENIPIYPYYHAISSGKTDNAEELLGISIPYLKTALSPKDEYKEEKEITESEISARLYAYYGEEEFSDIKLSDIKAEEKTGTGAVKSVHIGKKEVSGFDFREIFSLSSICFEIENEGNKLKITSHGIGSNLGMSENGAKVMAEEGYSCEEILKYYFSGITIEE